MDPAENLAAMNEGSGIDRLVTYFNQETAAEIVRRYGAASAITITNTFPHIQDLQGFASAVKTVLKPDKSIMIEARYLVNLLERARSTPCITSACRPGLSAHEAPVRAARTGGGERGAPANSPRQLRGTIRRAGEAKPSPSVEAMLAAERAMGVTSRGTAIRAEHGANPDRPVRDARSAARQQEADRDIWGPSQGDALIESCS